MLFGETGVAQHLKPGTAVMVSSTIASADAQEIATALAGFDLEMLDAPVSGGAVKAANGEMTVMASGSDIAFERLVPVLEAVAGKVYRIGAEPGLGSTVKIIHQLLAGVHIAAGAEAMALAARAGIPLDVMYDVVTNAGCVMWWMAITPRIQPSIFLLRILVWLPIQPKPCTSRCHWPQQH